MSLEKLLADTLTKDLENDFKNFDMTIGQQKVALTMFNSTFDYKVGDSVVRNTHGEGRYKFPLEGQAAMVTTIYPKPIFNESGRVVHGEIAVLNLDKTVNVFPVDFRFYKPAV